MRLAETEVADSVEPDDDAVGDVSAKRGVGRFPLPRDAHLLGLGDGHCEPGYGLRRRPRAVLPAFERVTRAGVGCRTDLGGRRGGEGVRTIDGIDAGGLVAESPRDGSRDDGVRDGHDAVETRRVDGRVRCHLVRRQRAVVDSETLHDAGELPGAIRLADTASNHPLRCGDSSHAGRTGRFGILQRPRIVSVEVAVTRRTKRKRRLFPAPTADGGTVIRAAGPLVGLEPDGVCVDCAHALVVRAAEERASPTERVLPVLIGVNGKLERRRRHRGYGVHEPRIAGGGVPCEVVAVVAPAGRGVGRDCGGVGGVGEVFPMLGGGIMRPLRPGVPDTVEVHDKPLLDVGVRLVLERGETRHRQGERTKGRREDGSLLDAGTCGFHGLFLRLGL